MLLDGEPDESYFLYFQFFPFLLHIFLFDLLELVSFEELYFFENESDNDGYGSGYPGRCTFPFPPEKSVGSVSGVGSGNFFPTGIDSLGDVVLLVVFVTRGVESKGGRLIESFWCPKY